MKPLVLLFALAAAPAGAQAVDTLFTWQTYAQEAHARVRLFDAPDDARPLTVVVDELAANRAGLVTDDVRYFVETVGRALGHDPATATYVFRFTARSFSAEADAGGKMLLLRATFNRTKSGRLSAPSWRVLTRDEVAELTDRALY